MKTFTTDFFNSRMIVCIVLTLMLAAPLVYFPFISHFKTKVYLRENTPLFSAPRIGAELKAFSGKASYFPVSGIKNYYFEKNPFGRVWYPIMEYTSFYNIQHEGKTLWASPDLLFSPGNIVENNHFSRNDYMFWVLWSMGGLLFLFFYGRKTFIRDFFQGRALGKDGFLTGFAAILLLLYLRCFLLFLYLYLSDRMLVVPTDEISYFAIGKDILNCKWDAKWNYTIGFPLAHIPFILLFNPAGYFDFYDVLIFFNAFLVAPLCLVLIFLIIQRLSGSGIKAFITVFFLTVLPFFYYPNEVWPTFYFRAFFIQPGLDLSSFRPYYLFFWTGLNALSDMFSCFLVLLCIWLGISMPPKRYFIPVISFIFGFACMVRLNNIFFAPLIAYQFYLKFNAGFADWKYLCRSLVAALFFFMLTFGWQLAVNIKQFGSIFIWPYSLHDGADKGFEFSMFLNGGMDFLIQTNLLYMTAGVIGMFFQGKRNVRNIFVLWAFPMIIFFCGYVCVAASPIRFIFPVYGALVGAFICMEIWGGYDRKTLTFIIAVIALNYLLVAPPFKYLLFNYPLQPLNLGRSFNGFYIQAFLHIAVPLLSVISSAVLLWHKKKLLVFMTVFFLIYYSGSAPLILSLMIVLLLITAVFVVRQVYASLLRKKTPAL